MATNGVITGTQSGTKPYLSIIWTRTGYSLEKNTTTISATLRLHSPYRIDFSATKRGVFQGKSFSYSGGAKGTNIVKNLTTQTIVVPHNEDGTKNLTLSGNITLGLDWGSGGRVNTLTVSGTAKMNTHYRQLSSIVSWGRTDVTQNTMTFSYKLDNPATEVRYRVNGGIWREAHKGSAITSGSFRSTGLATYSWPKYEMQAFSLKTKIWGPINVRENIWRTNGTPPSAPKWIGSLPTNLVKEKTETITWTESTSIGVEPIYYSLRADISGDGNYISTTYSSNRYASLTPDNTWTGKNTKFYVRAKNDFGYTDSAISSHIPVYNKVPSTPAAVTVKNLMKGKVATVSWQNSVDDRGRHISYYMDISLDGGPWNNIAETLFTEQTFNVGNSNGKVRFRIRAQAGDDFSGYGYSNTYSISESKPPTPSNITVPVPLTRDQYYTINWSASNSPDGSSLTYVLEESKDDGAWSVISNKLSNNFHRVFINKAYDRYRFRVKAVNNSGSSGYRYAPTRVLYDPLPQTPSRFDIPARAEMGELIEISWSESLYAQEYELQKSVDRGSYTTIYKGQKLSYSDQLDLKQTSVSYRIRAINLTGSSSYKVTIVLNLDLASPTVPSFLNVSPELLMSGQSLTANWGASTVLGGTVSYEIVISSPEGDNQIYTGIEGLTKIIPVSHVWDTARIAVYARSDKGSRSNAISSTHIVDHPAPTRPSNIAVSNLVGNREYKLIWTPSKDVQNKSIVYDIEVKNDGESWISRASNLTKTDFSYLIDDGINTKQFRIRGKNENKIGEWEYSNVFNVYHLVLPGRIKKIYMPEDTRGDRHNIVSWDPAQNALSYRVEVKYNDTNFERVTVSEITDTKIRIFVPKDKLTMQVRISVVAKDGISDYTFSTIETVKNFPEIQIKVNGELRTALEGWIKVDGVVREIDTIFMKNNGVVKEAE